MNNRIVELMFSAPGATPADIERAVAAGWGVFDAAGVENPWDAASAAFKQEAEDDELDFSDEEAALAEVWRFACREATEAGCAANGLNPLEADFGIVR